MLPETLPRLKAPREHGRVLIHPPLEKLDDLLRVNRQRLARPMALLTKPIADLRAQAQRETLRLTKEYLEKAGEPVPDWPGQTWLVAGHQPELFHPGVWFKNFLLQGLARRCQAVPINLVVDNDTAKNHFLRVPAGNHQAKVHFDHRASEIPFEERQIEDPVFFASFPERVAEYAGAWPFKPWLAEIWQKMARQKTLNLGERIVRVRRELERGMGLRPLEVPLSAVCQTEAFAWFACSMLADLDRFQKSYNRAVAQYRQGHGLHSKNHPVPDLAKEGDRVEAPFWIWWKGQDLRQRLFAQPMADGLILSAGATEMARLHGTPLDWVGQWQSFGNQGIKIRTRALTTTLFARLLLGDLFIHGIGGGKYDEVTDAIFRDYFPGFEPPAYMIATATLLLPLNRYPDADAELHRLHRQERDLWYNPQRHLANAGSAKAAAMALPEITHEQRVHRFYELQKATADLRPLVSAEIDDIRRHLVEIEQCRKIDAVAASRDYSFCLYPEEMLRTFLQAHA